MKYMQSELDKIQFGNRLKSLRKMAGYTQMEFSGMIDMSQHHITQIERGINFPSIQVFYKMCRALNIPADFLFIDNDKAFLIYSVIVSAGIFDDIDANILKAFVLISQSLKGIENDILKNISKEDISKAIKNLAEYNNVQ